MDTAHIMSYIPFAKIISDTIPNPIIYETIDSYFCIDIGAFGVFDL